ncbi:TIGR01244 family phosphatase [Reinekea forsetii]|nr:TIGR01244 family phosphatase [Reinekea forsetii]
MTPTQIAENYFVSAQITADDVQKAKEEGFDVIICNRPDEEEPGQPNHGVIKAACDAVGIRFEFMPMQGPNFTPEYVEGVKALIASNKKTLGYCRTGNRCSILFNAAQ